MLNRSQKLEIGSKLLKNAILHLILRACAKTKNVVPLFPPAPRVKQVLAY